MTWMMLVVVPEKMPGVTYRVVSVHPLRGDEHFLFGRHGCVWPRVLLELTNEGLVAHSAVSRSWRSD